VSIGDAGFVLGTTVAEQLRTFAGELFRLDDHLDRLQQALQIVGVDPGMTLDELGRIGRELVARNHRLLAPGDDLGLSIVVTPGPYPTYGGPVSAEPTVCLHTYPLPFRLWVQQYGRGQSLVTTDVRQVSSKCWPPELKCRSRMHYYLADRSAAAIEPGGRALLLDDDGLVTETSTANILVFRSDEGLISPPAAKILHGISLAEAFELAKTLGVTVVQRDLTPQDVATADEVLLGSTPLCLLPVTRFNGRPIGDGKPGDLFRRLLDAWSESVGVDIVAQAEQFAERR
ncbi:MAG: aminotransferase class IV, partial [Thermoguttaceae bacterium]